MPLSPVNPRRLFIWLLLLAHLVALAILLRFPDGIWPASLIGGRLRIANGLVHGEIAVIAAWAAWSQMTLALRLPLAALGAFAAAYVLLTIIDSAPSYVPIEITILTLATGLMHCLLVFGMCRGARAFGIDWRNLSSGETPHRRRAQFHLWELLALMAAFAVCLGLLRLLWPEDTAFDWAKMSEDRLTLSIVFLVANLLLANSVVTVYWIPRGWLWNLAITLSLAAIITLLEWLAARSLDLRRSFAMFGWMNATFLGWLLFSLAMLRLAGYRLERVRFPKWTRLKGAAHSQPTISSLP